MKIHDISVSISPELVVWPGDPSVVLEQVKSMDKGARDNISRLACGVHIGTHVDAPHHFLNDHRTVESLSLNILTGPAQVIQIDDREDLVTADLLKKANILPATRRILLKTRNSKHWQNGSKIFDERFVAISPDGAEWLVKAGMKLVGIDYLSIAPYKQSVETHQILLKPGIVVVEGIDLSGIAEGNYELFCLPLKLIGSEGAPARAILIE